MRQDFLCFTRENLDLFESNIFLSLLVLLKICEQCICLKYHPYDLYCSTPNSKLSPMNAIDGKILPFRTHDSS